MKNYYICKKNFEVMFCYGSLTKWFKVYIKDFSNDNFAVVELSDEKYMFEDAENHYFVSSIDKNTLTMRKFIEENMEKMFDEYQCKRLKYIYGL